VLCCLSVHVQPHPQRWHRARRERGSL
jgi:hypothetical protein